MTKQRASKISIRLEPGEALVVGRTEVWQYLVEVCKELAHNAETPEDVVGWVNTADWIQTWIDDTSVPEHEDVDSDGDWQ